MMTAHPSDCPIPRAESYSVPTGRGSLGVLILGESLGDAEAREHRPFVEWAEAGALLERAIRRCGFSREQFVMWNAVPVHPPHNYLEGAPYEAAAVEWGRGYLETVLKTYPIRSILSLGNIPLRQLTGLYGEKRGISSMRGWVLRSRYGTSLVPAFHPSFIRRGALPLFPDLMHCLKLAVAVANCPVGGRTVFHSPVVWRDYEYRAHEPAALETPIVPTGYIQSPSEQEAWDYARDIERHPGWLVAYDIETPRSGESTEDESDELGDRDITSIQFSTERRTGIYFPWREPYTEIAKVILATPNRKAGANTWRFDDPLLEAHHCRINGERHDVRWAFHHLQPDLKGSLDFIASFYCPMHEGWTAWKHLHDSHVAHYGIRDVDAVQWILNDGTT
jgi:uracil-DNA glycosylase family 4